MCREQANCLACEGIERPELYGVSRHHGEARIRMPSSAEDGHEDDSLYPLHENLDRQVGVFLL